MTKKRKPQHRNPAGHIHGIPYASTTQQDAGKLQTDVNTASILNPPVVASANEQGKILDVDKIGFLGGAEPIMTGVGTAYLQTVDGTFYRLPPELNMWARDVVTMVLSAGGRQSGIFPTRIEFGNLNGRIYAEMLSDS